MSGDHNMYASGSGDGHRSGWRKRQILDMAEKASQSKQDWWKDDDALEAFAELVREAERESCAKVCNELFADVPPYSSPDCAVAIQARNNT